MSLDLFDGIPALVCDQPQRVCPKCRADIPDDLLSCLACAVASLPPAPVSRAALLKQYQSALNSYRKAGQKVTDAVAALAKDCQHELVRESWNEGNNGYGRQWKNFYKQCVFCGHKEATGTD